MNHPSANLLGIIHLPSYPPKFIHTPHSDQFHQPMHPFIHPPSHPAIHPPLLGVFREATEWLMQTSLDIVPVCKEVFTGRDTHRFMWMKGAGSGERKQALQYAGLLHSEGDTSGLAAVMVSRHRKLQQDRCPENTTVRANGNCCSSLSTWTLCPDPGILRLLLDSPGPTSSTGLCSISMGSVQSSLESWFLRLK